MALGTGKSTLLQALVGEAMLKQGFIYTKAPQAAYVAQTPWIRNASVRENILGVSNYDGTWYQEVVKACALDYDIAKMPAGDKTLVGSGGISLSGGQKQRLALARAVYSKLQLIMIDGKLIRFCFSIAELKLTLSRCLLWARC
jgi:ATP-binding cassette subfamily C (CFTR/MRP) protein 1